MMNSAPTMEHAASGTFSFARGYLVTMRPYLMFLSGVTGIAGMSFGNTGDPLRLVSIFAACFLSYGFGQALTDCFQTDTDAISSPYRPLTRGAISRPATMAVSLAGVCACVGILGFWNPWNFVIGLLAGAGLATYTWFKRRWWGGPWYNAWIVCALFIMAALASGWEPGGNDRMVSWALTGIFFGYANFVLAGYFKDIGADRATGYDTFPVRFGRRNAVLVSDAFAAGLAISAAVIIVHGTPGGTGGVGGSLFFLASVVMLVLGQWELHRNSSDDRAYRSIVPVVHAYILFLAGVAASKMPGWFFPLLGFYLAFCSVIMRRPERSQI